jgi:2-polyprenyl-3-methyl-5-hydroxy-6-metoxy-1,4-benzoquinol methylase
MSDATGGHIASVARYSVVGGIDLDADTSHARVIRAVGVGKRVLELGSAVGDTTRVLAQHNCSVVAVELDPSGVAASAAWAERVIAANLEAWDLRTELRNERFDVVVAADVLEHIRNPESVLRQVHGLLGPGGYVVASIPNIAHGAMRLALLGGAFDYADVGLLDRTHVRFFTLSTMTTMFEECGYTVTDVQRVVRAYDDAMLPYRPEDLTPDVARILADDPESQTFQFIVVAEPAIVLDGPEPPPVAGEPPELVIERLRQVNDVMAGQIRAAATRNELLATRTERDRLISELTGLHGSRTWRVAYLLARMSRAARSPGLVRAKLAQVARREVPRVELPNASPDPPSPALSRSAHASQLRVLAFYLPQFHPIMENDAWWGPGFTEWTNMVKAQPLFRDHYQPHLPADLGFYDLRVAEVREAQAAMAREYGIDGFVYYHYWFNGHRLLNRPFDEVISSGEPDFPFCLCWANENWTRVWDGGDQQVLAAQHYSDEDDLAHIRELLPALFDPRYITVDAKPVLLVYRVSHLPNPLRTVNIWRREAERAGLPGLYMCCVQSHTLFDRQDPALLGFDAAVEFQPDAEWAGPPVAVPGSRRRLREPVPRPGSENVIYFYERLVEGSICQPSRPYRRYRSVTPSWDNSPRRSKAAAIFVGSTPQLYERWLRSVVQSFVPFSTDENFVFVNGWNEWAEGNHLEPDQRWGRGYLEATRRALA